MHKELAVAVGIPEENILVGKNGQVFEVNRNHIKISGEVQAGKVLVDGLGIGDVGNVVLRDRKHLSEEGILTIAMTYNKTKKAIVGQAEIISRGFVYVKDSQDIMEGAYKVIDKVVEEIKNKNITDTTFMKYLVRDKVKSYVFSEIKRDPLILPIIMEVE